METKDTITQDNTMDVRPIPCSIKHGMIMKRWFELATGDHFILLNDHDPVPLYYQFQAQFGNAFSWEYVERGPEDFRVRITKRSAVAPVAMSSPCGGGQ